MRGTLKLMSLRLINEKTLLFNLYSSSLWVFVPLWLNSSFYYLLEIRIPYQFSDMIVVSLTPTAKQRSMAKDMHLATRYLIIKSSLHINSPLPARQIITCLSVQSNEIQNNGMTS